ncbi:hypothetical protein ABOM_009958 [Aspergillus bombycis]|uniref:NACHT domain-containing protein n=1 Tax=Aspergillus bombycis TaxID=109264 RepID=A0A1F7ZQC0_9EURO|nr:hypothetical protein ABOM_009958 [Aspergillus bombycis]OGM41660.1 hypothetical protein ABOM_009958 [Aspergillus bombycis]
MDPLAAVGLASNIISFIDFTWELVTGAWSVYKSADGTTVENATLGTIITDLEKASSQLISDIKGTTQNEKALLLLAEECWELSQQLSDTLRKLKAKVENSKWESLKTKWTSMRKEKEIMSIESRLSKYRSQIFLRLQFMFGHQQSLVNARLDSILNDARKINNEHARQLESLRKELLDAVEHLRELHEEDGQKWTNKPDEAPVSMSSYDVCSALTHVYQLSVNMANENEILSRLYYPSMYYREDSEQDKAADQGDNKLTAKKVEMRDSFLQWLRNGTGIYHVSGKAGSGKSTLMKLLCDSSRVREELRSWAKPHQLVFAKFFFWNAGDQLQRSIEGLYRAILFEVLKGFPQLIPHVFPDNSIPLQSSSNDASLPHYRLEEVKIAFMKLVALPAVSNQRICLFIDGLDEYEGDSLDHWSIARDMELWTRSKGVKICVTSRPHTEFMESFYCCPRQQIQLHLLTRSDIRQYCLAMMEKDRHFERIKATYRELAESIVIRADGVFLWARLATRSFLGGVGYRDSPETLRRKLGAIPDDMKALFDNMLGGVDSSAREEADKLLLIALELTSSSLPAILYSWLDDLHDVEFPYCVTTMGSFEEELQNRSDIVRSKIDSLSKGLLELHTQPSTEGCSKYEVAFFHRAARDYLRDSKANQLKKRLPHFDVQESCCRLLLAYLIFGRIQYDKGQEVDDWFSIWVVLSSLLACLSHSPTSSKIVAVCENMWGTSILSHILIRFHYCGRNTLSVLHSQFENRFPYLCWLLCEKQTHFVLERLAAGTSLPKDPSFQRQLFLLSVVYGHTDVVRILLQKGLSPKDKFPVELGEGRKGNMLSLWIIALTLCAQQMIDNPNSKSAGILQEILSFSSELDHDAYFLVHLYKDGKEMRNIGPEQLKIISLQQLLTLRDTRESRQLVSLITRRTQSHWWNRLMASAPSCSKMDYQPFTGKIPESQELQFRIYSVQTRREKFEGGLEFFIG